MVNGWRLIIATHIGTEYIFSPYVCFIDLPAEKRTQKKDEVYTSIHICKVFNNNSQKRKIPNT